MRNHKTNWPSSYTQLPLAVVMGWFLWVLGSPAGPSAPQLRGPYQSYHYCEALNRALPKRGFITGPQCYFGVWINDQVAGSVPLPPGIPAPDDGTGLGSSPQSPDHGSEYPSGE